MQAKLMYLCWVFPMESNVQTLFCPFSPWKFSLGTIVIVPPTMKDVFK